MGLLDFISPQDEGQRQRNIAFFQQLAQAGAPSATPNSWALGLANGFGEGNKAQLAYQRFAGTQDLQKQEIEMNKLKMDVYKQEQERKEKLRQFLSGMNQGQGSAPQTAANFTNSALSAHFNGGDAFSPESIGAAAQQNAAIPASAGQSALSAWQRYQGIGDKLSAEGFVEEAKPYYEMADKWKPKYKADTIRDAKTGRTVMLADDGSSLDTGMTAAEKAHFADTGGKIVPLDPYTGQPIAGGGAVKTMSPGEQASNAVAWANYGLGKQRLAMESANQNKPQIVQTENGPLLVDTRTGTGKAVIGPDGQPILSTKPLTEFQGKAVMFGTRAKAADKVLNGLEDKISTTGLAAKQSAEGIWGVGGILGAAGNSMLTKQQQQVDQAQRDFINAVLRQESGASISPAEFDNARKQYFPQPGDSAAVVEQKRLNRQNAINGFTTMAGSGAKAMIPAVAPTMPAQTSQDLPKSKFFQVGGRQLAGQLGSDGSYYVVQNGKRYRIEE